MRLCRRARPLPSKNGASLEKRLASTTLARSHAPPFEGQPEQASDLGEPSAPAACVARGCPSCRFGGLGQVRKDGWWVDAFVGVPKNQAANNSPDELLHAATLVCLLLPGSFLAVKGNFPRGSSSTRGVLDTRIVLGSDRCVSRSTGILVLPGKLPLEVTLWHGAGQTVPREAKNYRNIR